MLVFTEDVQKLVTAATRRYEEKSHTTLLQSKAVDFYSGLVEDLNREHQAQLRASTFYKHFAIRSRSYGSPQIGYSITYLNALAQYAHGKDYLEVYELVVEGDHEIPEFPWGKPCFPATPTVKVTVPGFTNVWLKDEGSNPTGVHKDRRTHELVLLYERLMGQGLAKRERVHLPRMGLISSGYAALSIQYRFRQQGFPDLKVILDNEVKKNKGLHNMLVNSRAELHFLDLGAKELSSEDIKQIANLGPNGLDLTHDAEPEISDIRESFYDWLSYEVLNLNPDMVVVPYGTGELYENIRSIHIQEMRSRRNSRRYFGDRKILRGCVFIGARVEDANPKTLMPMLMAHHRVNPIGENASKDQYCGEGTGVYVVGESKKRIAEAEDIAKENGIRTCPSGIAGLTYLLQMRQDKKFMEANRDRKIVVVNTGTIREELFASPL